MVRRDDDRRLGTRSAYLILTLFSRRSMSAFYVVDDAE